jgi:general secretion pathway protein A
MYLQFFNLKKEPFQITPDPSFLYLSRGHEQALASIIYGVEKRKGFVLIIGDVGVGKTTVLRAYLEKVEKETLKTIYLFNSNISYHNLLKHLLREFGVQPQSDDSCDMVNQLYEILVEEYRQGRTVLLLIDEAQNMPVDTLENLRMLSNLETANEKLLQIVFSAQPEFEKTMNLEELKQLKQRVALRAVISPLTQEEGLTYIHHRLKTAADEEAAIFTPFALREIVRVAKGIPRVINVLCDNSLITAFGYGKPKVGLSVVKEITRDFGMQRSLFQQWRLPVVVALLVAGVGYYGLKSKGVSLAMKPPQKVQVVELPVNFDASALPAPASHKKTKTKVKTKTLPVKPANAVKDNATVTRMVAKGDTLNKMIKDVYGVVKPGLIRKVKDANPEMANENLIIEGDKIVFPVVKD